MRNLINFVAYSISYMFLIGKYHYLEADEFTDHGLFFINADPNLAKFHSLKPRILLPGSELKDFPPITVGDKLLLFVYQDSQGRPTVTLKNSLLCVNEIALLKVVEISDSGAYADMGLAKDLFIPNNLLIEPIEVGARVPVLMFLDETTLRLTGSMRVDGFLLNQPVPDCKEGDQFDAFVLRKTDLGYLCIVNKQFEAVMFFEDYTENWSEFDSFTAVVRHIRPDNKINIIAHRSKKDLLDHNTRLVFDALKNHGGTLQLSDSSSPETIRNTVNLSKKAFKSALGILYKRGIVELKPNKTVLKSHVR